MSFFRETFWFNCEKQLFPSCKLVILEEIMNKIIQHVESKQIQKAKAHTFKTGDLINVQVKVKEGNRERLQGFEGVVIAIKNSGLNSSFTVRKESHGEGVERVFQTHSKAIDSVKVIRRGDVRKAKLYYLRERTGRNARIKEKISQKPAEQAALPIEVEAEETTGATE